MKLSKFSGLFEAATQSAAPVTIPASASSLRIVLTKRLEAVLKKMEDNDNYLAFEMLWLGEPSSKYVNGLNITQVDISAIDYSFNVLISGKKYDMKIGKFFRYYWPGTFGESEIKTFILAYRDMVSDNVGVGPGTGAQPVLVPAFSYNPKDVRATFLSLTTKTYPYGHDEEVLKFLPSDLKKDPVGNYYKIIGNAKPKVMFTSHLDTADREQKSTKLFSAKGRVDETGHQFRLVRTGQGDEHLYTDGSSILGADDKAGIAVMLYMMASGVEGLYYFFIGEERGGIGSNALSGIYDQVEYLAEIKQCVSFDRRRTTSVITHQLGRQCCSNAYGQALCNELGKSGLSLSLDTTGVYTDSASFMDDIAECTNISVGYYNEHRGTEMQNISYLKRLAEASTKVNWNSLPISRKVGYNLGLYAKHKNLIAEIKKNMFGIEVKVIGRDDRIFVNLDLEQPDMDEVYDSLIRVQTILSKYKIEDSGVFDDTKFKIELR